MTKSSPSRSLPSAAMLAALATIACGSAPPEVDVPPADASLPAPDGLSRPLTWAMDRYLDYSASSGARSGFIALLAQDGHVVHGTASGYADIDAERPFELDTPVRIASMTKPIVAVGAMILVEEGKIGLDTPVSDYIPAAATLEVATSHDAREDGGFDTQPAQTPMTVRHLLHFASGLGAGNFSEPNDLEKLWDDHGVWKLEGTLEERVDRLLSLPLLEEPGTRWRYGASADVLGRVIEVASGQPLDVFLEERLFAPLGMDDTGFYLGVDDPPGLAKVYTQDENEALVEVPGFPREFPSGGGGLISTAPDYMRFALMLWNGGLYDGVQILEKGTVAEMMQPVVDGVLEGAGIEGQSWGLGLAVVDDADATETPDRTGDSWWAGYYGTTFIVSPTTGLVAVVISQNEPGPHSGLPLHIYVAQGLAYSAL